MDSGRKETMDLSANSGAADTSSKTPVEEGQPTYVNANKEETPSTEGSKNEEPTQAREVKDACDIIPVVKAKPVSTETPVTSSSSPGTTPSIAPPKTPESDCGSFCECDSPADSTGEAHIPQDMEHPEATNDGGHIAPEPNTKSPAAPTVAPPSLPVPSEKVPEQTGPVSEPAPVGAPSEDKPTAVVPAPVGAPSEDKQTAVVPAPVGAPSEDKPTAVVPTPVGAPSEDKPTAVVPTPVGAPSEDKPTAVVPTPVGAPSEDKPTAVVPTPVGAPSEDKPTAVVPTEQLTATSEQLTATSEQLTATSEQLTATSEQLTATTQVQQVTLAPPKVQSETPAPATTQSTTVPTKEPSEKMHLEEPPPEKCSAPVTTPVPVAKPRVDTTPVIDPESAATVDSNTAPEAEPTPVPVPKALPVSEEVPAAATEPAAVPPTKSSPDSEPAPTPPGVKESQPVASPAPVTASGTTQPKGPIPSSVPPSVPVTEATPPISKPDPISTPVPVTHAAPVGEPTSVDVPKSVPAAGSSTEAVPVITKDTEKPRDLSCAAPPPPAEQAAPASPPKTPNTEIAKENNIEGQPGVPSVNDVKDKEEKSEEEAMEVDNVEQTASVEKVGTQPEPQATALPSKLPTDAPPSMDDDSLSMGAHGDSKEATKATAAEEPMEILLGVPVAGCSSEESSKDAPPLDFKPFSHYTEDGKLIDKEEEKPTAKVPPVSAHDVAAVALAATGESVSVDDSFPGRREELSESVKSQPGSCQPTEVSQFQGQFMDFLKCNDNATQHSFGADGKPLPPSSQGEATVGSEVTADGEATTQSEVQEGTSDVPTTPQSGKRRKRRTKAQMIADRAAAAAAAAGNFNNDDASNASLADSQKGSRSVRKRKQNEDEATKDGQTTDGSPSKDGTLGTTATFPPEKLFEYQWPQTDKNSDWFFLQEHLSAFLGVKSFKRKYPTLERRPVSMPERNFLQESGVVSEMMCDLGLTALKSDQVYELMLRDFAEKYQQYAEVLHEREQVRRSQEKNKIVADMASVTKNNVVDVVKKAVRSAAEFNAQFMRERREERKAYFDMQTCEIHYPKSTIKVLPPALTKVCAYPVALIPGQFSEYYKKYTPQQMKYFPLNTCMYDPPRHLKTIYADPADKYESELDSQSASSKGDADDGSSSSGSSSGSGSDGDSDSSSDVEEKEVPAPTPAPPTNKKSTKTPRGKKQQPQQQQPQPPPEEEPVPVKDTATMCNICQGTSEKNKIGEAEELVKCAECGRHGHPSCLELTIEMIPNIKTYPWQCMECKTCVECMDPYDEDKMMFCDHCDRGYHTFCVGLRSIPTGRWECPSCRPEPPASKKRRRQPPQKLETAA